MFLGLYVRPNLTLRHTPRVEDYITSSDVGGTHTPFSHCNIFYLDFLEEMIRSAAYRQFVGC